MYAPDDFVRAEQLVNEGVAVDRLITAVYPLDELPLAFATALTGEQVKIHVRGAAADIPILGEKR